MQRPQLDEHAAAEALCQTSLGSGLAYVRCVLQLTHLLVSLHTICRAHVSCLGVFTVTNVSQYRETAPGITHGCHGTECNI